MSGKANDVRGPEGQGRQARRREATRAEIVAAAWDLVAEHGLAGLSLRDLGARVGMRAQSLYSYFGSKDEIYDAMFHEGYVAFGAWTAAVHDDPRIETDPVAVLRSGAHRYVAFCTADPVRYQLLFQRTIPGFVPSPASYAVAVEVLEHMAAAFEAMGVTDPAAVDLWTAVLTGLVDQQISNDPGGDRWVRLVDRAVDLLVDGLAPHLRHPAR